MFRGIATLNLTENQQIRRDSREKLRAEVGSFPWQQLGSRNFLDQHRTQSHSSLGRRTFHNYLEAADRKDLWPEL